MLDTKPKNLLLIQVLRGIASLLVVLLHASTNLNYNTGHNFLYGIFTFGGAGVDIFFVLSGFIITYTNHQGLSNSANFLPFLSRRFVRIYPIYWIIISFFLIIQLSLPSFYGQAYSISTTNLLSTYLLLPGHTMVNGVSWTLSAELFFYFLFSLAFFVRNKSLLISAMIIYSFVIIGAYATGFEQKETAPWTNLFLFPMNIEFFMGIASAMIAGKISSRYSRPLILIGVILFTISAVLRVNGFELFHNDFDRVTYFGVPSLLIITGVANLELQERIKKVNKWLLSLGDASYSLYLLHLPVMAAVAKLIAKSGVTNIYLIHFILLIVIIVICYASIIFFRLIEKPLIKKLNALLGSRRVFSGKYV